MDRRGYRSTWVAAPKGTPLPPLVANDLGRTTREFQRLRADVPFGLTGRVAMGAVIVLMAVTSVTLAWFLIS